MSKIITTPKSSSQNIMVLSDDDKDNIYLPNATKDIRGVVKIGDGIDVESGVISINTEFVDAAAQQVVEDYTYSKGETDNLVEELEEQIDIIANGAVRFDTTQTLTEPQKSRARMNIGVSSGVVDGQTTILTNEDKVKVIGVASDTDVITGNDIRDFFTLNVYEAGD